MIYSEIRPLVVHDGFSWTVEVDDVLMAVAESEAEARLYALALEGLHETATLAAVSARLDGELLTAESRATSLRPVRDTSRDLEWSVAAPTPVERRRS